MKNHFLPNCLPKVGRYLNLIFGIILVFKKFSANSTKASCTLYTEPNPSVARYKVYTVQRKYVASFVLPSFVFFGTVSRLGPPFLFVPSPLPTYEFTKVRRTHLRTK
jgi:hypothetical protein